ncbi:hypothetical protein SteCoe_30743 [Stentor coeruleus]|uniref:Uncharacterized protein n=1 Tax=Stentor coeruleus TaxID=5963 RepID=A0A1R2B2Y7_9CILI|nr:hypothetical protein SteCoe_30743 [Stentor coeruleus]
MKPLPALSRLTLKVLNDSAQVQAITVSSFRNTDSLSYDHSSQSEIFSNLDFSLAGSHLWALIYEIPGNESSLLLFRKLEEAVKTDNGGYQIGIFHEPASNYCNFYLLAHQKDYNTFGNHFKGAKLAIFLYSFQDLFGSNCDNYIKYLTAISCSKSALTSILRESKIEKSCISDDIKALDNIIVKYSKKNNKLQKKIVTAKKIIRKLHSRLSEETEENNEKHKIKCRNNKKDLVSGYTLI